MDDTFRAALRFHQAGQIGEAARLYQAVLARQPAHPDALHLLGVAAYQLRQPEQAVELIARAIALRPAAATYYANLAEVWRALGRPDDAEGACLHALRLQPDYPEALHNLGLILHDKGDGAGAIAAYRRALDVRPDFAAAHNSLGSALRASGEEAEALEHFRRAVACDPRSAEALTNLGQLLCERGELDEALGHCEHAVQMKPDFAEAQSNLGNVLRDLGRLDEARRRYAEALRLDPRIGTIHANMAQLLHEEGRLDEALSLFERAVALDPRSPRLRCKFAAALAEADRHDEAAAHLEIALRLDPRSAQAHGLLGTVRQEQRRDDDAKAHLLAALAIKPELPDAHCGLGVVHEELGDLRGAEAAFGEALRHDPDHDGALAHLATLLRGRLDDEHLVSIRRLLARPDEREGRRAALLFGLAQALDGRGEFAEAAVRLREANALARRAAEARGEAYDPARHAEFVSGVIAACDAGFFERVRGLGLDTERPVFVFGLPRSGTTLIEQILASHSGVFGAGELRLAAEHFEALPAAMCRDDPPLACLSRLDRDAIATLGRDYLDRLRSLAPSASRIVDKMPDNHQHLGLLAALFPRARFIHCRRDPRDVAVSCWMTHFRKIRWANDPGHIASRFAEYGRLMDHWRATLPVPMLEVAYEDTVADLEGVARRLVAWCGLEWEPACLEFHRSERPVRTASVAQVRQPLYTRAVARWKHYESDLGDLFAQLVPGPARERRA